jgi:N-acetylneuraminic acid mutarotase
MKNKKNFLSFVLFLFVFFSFSQNWQQLPGFPAAGRDDGSVFIIGNNVYCGLGNAFGIGPSTDFYRFNPVNDTWTTYTVSSLPALGRQYCCSFAYNNFGYVVSGVDANWNATNQVWRYDTTTNNWQQKTSMPDSVQGAACFFINNKTYICGGRNQANQCTKNVWEYDVINNSWLKKNNMPDGGRWRASAAVINNKGYLIFGADASGKFSNKLFEYDAGLDVWTLIDSFPGQGRTYTSMCAVNNLLVTALGIDSANSVYNDCHIYDISAHQWINQNPLPSFGRKGCMAFAFNNAMYITAGIDGTNNRLTETWKAGNINAIGNHIQKNISLNISPIPATEEIKFSIEEVLCENIEINITNAYGKVFFQDIGKAQSGTINISDFSNGIYFFRVKFNNEISTKKFIVNK